MLKIAHDFADIAHDGEGSGVLADDFRKDTDLGFIDDADQNVGFVTGIHALGRNQGGTVMQTGDDGIGKLLGIIGDDLEADGASAVFDHLIRNSAGHEAVKDTQNHGLDLITVDKIADARNHDIHAEDHIEEIQLRMLFPDQGGDEIDAAGVGAGLGQGGVDRAADDARPRMVLVPVSVA